MIRYFLSLHVQCSSLELKYNVGVFLIEGNASVSCIVVWNCIQYNNVVDLINMNSIWGQIFVSSYLFRTQITSTLFLRSEVSKVSCWLNLDKVWIQKGTYSNYLLHLCSPVICLLLNPKIQKVIAIVGNICKKV